MFCGASWVVVLNRTRGSGPLRTAPKHLCRHCCTINHCIATDFRWRRPISQRDDPLQRTAPYCKEAGPERMTKAKALRALLTSGKTQFLMEAHNGLSARIAEEAGFLGLWGSGLAISASMG